MKKTLLTLLVFCATVFAATAQQAQDSKSTPTSKEDEQKTAVAKQKAWQDKLTAELKLTPEQITKIAELNKAFDDRQANMEAMTTLTEEQKVEKRAMLKKAREANLMKLLTPEQQARYTELVTPKK